MIEAQIVQDRSDLAEKEWHIKWFGEIFYYDTLKECIKWCIEGNAPYEAFDWMGYRIDLETWPQQS